MKRLQLVFGVIGIFIISVIFFNCGGSKTEGSKYSFVQNPPFSVEGVYSQKWMAGVEEGGTGINIYFKIEKMEPGTVMNEIYFRNKKTKANKKNDNLFIGYFKNEQKDIIMDSNSTNEAKNIPPQKIPFQLAENEAVLSYIYKGIAYYFKVYNIAEKEVIAYPQSDPNNDK